MTTLYGVDHANDIAANLGGHVGQLLIIHMYGGGANLRESD
jgi:hypothetical protein